MIFMNKMLLVYTGEETDPMEAHKFAHMVMFLSAQFRGEIPNTNN